MDNPIQLRNALFAIRGVLAFVAFTEVRKTFKWCINAIKFYSCFEVHKYIHIEQCVCCEYELLVGVHFSPLPFAFGNG